MSVFRQYRRIGLVVLVAAASAMASFFALAPVGAQENRQREPVYYFAPLRSHVVDPFRPPAHIGAPGNRGLEYADSENEIVLSAAPGYVRFAGPVGGTQAITIQHEDGIRTTYTGLLQVFVEPGMTLIPYSAIGVASSAFHFGARIKDHYLDPQILIDASVPEERVRLIPEPGP